MKKSNIQNAKGSGRCLQRLVSLRRNAKPFDWTEATMQEALDANQDLGNLWPEDGIRGDWSLARSMVAAGMRADGATLKKVAQRLGVTTERARQIMGKLRRMVNRRREQANAPRELPARTAKDNE